MPLIIKILVSGILKRYFDQTSFQIVLNDNATLRDLYEYIHAHWVECLPPSIWNRDKKKFRGPVIVMSEQRVLKNDDEKLYNEQIINMFRFISGG